MYCRAPHDFAIRKFRRTFAAMFIQLAKGFHENKDGSISVYPNYRLMKAYRDADGKPAGRAVLSLCALEGMTDADRDELTDLLTVIIETRQCMLCEDRALYEIALSYYAKYRETRYTQKNDPILIAERERKEHERNLHEVDPQYREVRHDPEVSRQVRAHHKP